MMMKISVIFCGSFKWEDFQFIGETARRAPTVVLAMRHEPDYIGLDYMMPHMNAFTSSMTPVGSPC